MAKIVFGDGLADYAWLQDFFNWELTLSASSATSATFDDSKGSSIVITGTNLEFDGDSLTGGKIKGVELISDGGETLITLTGGNFSAKIFEAENSWDFLSSLSAGNDTLIGNDLGTDLNGMAMNTGNDKIIAGDGGSFMGGSEGKDSYRGTTDGWDTLSYDNAMWDDTAKRGVVVNAAKGTATDSWGDKDTFSKIEEFRGADLNDTFKGSKGDDTFMGFQGYEYYHAYTELNLKLTSGIYGSTFFMLTGFHGAHVLLGTIMLIVMWFRAAKGHFTRDNHFGFEAAAWYWHFVDVVWLMLFLFVYVL